MTAVFTCLLRAWLGISCGPLPAAPPPIPPVTDQAATDQAAGDQAGARSEPALQAERERLAGHRVRVTADGSGYTIMDIAGEGAPVVGVVERRGDHLWLVTGDRARYRLTGPLARPRIAGPGYKVWVLGDVIDSAGHPAGGPVLRPRRLGVLAPP